MSESYISVSQLNMYIKNIFEAEVMLQNICVYGEVSSYNISNNIAYFNLKDENGLLSCVLFGASSFDVPKIGDMILVKGSMSYWTKGGRLSFNATSIMPYGKGLIYEKFLQLKTKLEKLGYFDVEHKKPIPARVKRIGVVTSSTGAVIRDIIDVTTRRNNTLDIVLYPVKVQGVGAENEIAKGIEFFSNYDAVDVVIVARGGGSIEDLEPFNTEIVADATYNCQKPIVSAVGHETDFTIIDFVADLRAPTPSAAAEIVAWNKSLEIEKIYKQMLFMEKIIANKISLIKKDIDICFKKIDNLTTNKLILVANKVKDKIYKLNGFTLKIDEKFNKIKSLEIILNNYNPKKLSDMGYSKVIQEGISVSKLENLDLNKDIEFSMIDGNLKVKASKV